MTTSTTISGSLIYHVRLHYEQALNQIISGNVVRYGINGYTDHSIPSYILSVATVEAFINEAFLSQWSKLISKDSPLWNLSKEYLEKLELPNKLIIVPELLFQKSFLRNKEPYQDMAILIKIRNLFVHYKMTYESPKFIKTLDEKGITLKSNKKDDRVDFAWTHKLSSSEGIRWAHNTACNVIQTLASYAPEDRLQNDPILYLAKQFTIIPYEYPLEWFKKNGIDPRSSHP
jgi:hypothetical protein